MNDERSDALERSMRIYACRIARLCFLKGHCHETDHPVLQTEIQLVEMAQSKLMEQVTASVGSGPRKKDIETIERSLISMAAGWIQSSVDDEEDREAVMSRLEQVDFSWLGFWAN